MSASAPWIQLDNQTVNLSLDDLASLDATLLSPTARAAHSFCSEWLGGKAEFIVHTSGSTGTPKPIRLSREMMTASARKTAEALGLSAGDVALCALDPQFIAGMMMLVRCMTIGMNSIVVAPSANPLKSIPSGQRIHFTALVPYQVQATLESEEKYRFEEIDRVIIGGAPISPDLLDMIRNTRSRCFATFGMTETVSHIALQSLNTSDANDSFEALPGVKVSIDSRGCLVIHADYLPDDVVTNDIVSLLSPTRFRWLGRWDNIINSGGIKVVPEKIDLLVAKWMIANKMERRFFVSSMPHDSLGNQVVLVVEGEPATPIRADLHEFLAEKLSKYEVPRKTIYRTKFQETATGKVDRRGTLASPGPDH